MTHHSAEHRTAEMNQCIANCTDCHAVSLETISYCLSKGGQHAEEHHISLLAACADICRTSADTMLRGADVHTYVCAACASICEECADSCGRMNDPEMAKCVEDCRRCAETCARMSPR
jgi:hypothetical protein